MISEFIIALVVLVTVAAHVALYRWVKFKIHEGLILNYLRSAGEEGTSNYHHADAIAGHTQLTAKRIAVVCQNSGQIHPDPNSENHWCAS